MQTKRILVAASVALLMLTPLASAQLPLQIYIEGSSYNTTLETWITTSSSFKLWVVGNPNTQGTIFDVKLSASFYGTGGSMSIAPTVASAGIFTAGGDLSLSILPVDLGSDETQFAGSDAFTSVQNHAEYADADAHQFWRIGDFSLTDSPIADYDEFFTEPYSSTKFGQINAYDVTVSGWDAVHFDAFDHTINNSGNEVWRHSAYSHDGTGNVIPEPGTLALLGIGLAGLGARLRRKV